MYQCEECGRVFEHPQKIIEKHYELDDNSVEVYYACPHCESSDYHETVRCCECEEYIDKDLKTQYVRFKNGDVVCDNCLHEYCSERLGA